LPELADRGSLKVLSQIERQLFEEITIVIYNVRIAPDLVFNIVFVAFPFWTYDKDWSLINLNNDWFGTGSEIGAVPTQEQLYQSPISRVDSTLIIITQTHQRQFVSCPSKVCPNGIAILSVNHGIGHRVCDFASLHFPVVQDHRL